MSAKHYITVKLRVADKHAAALNKKARAVNFVWNFANETQQTAVKRGRKWLTGYELQKLTSGSSAMLGLQADSINKVCEAYAIKRRSAKKPWLRWRSRKTLGWIPIKGSNLKKRGNQYWLNGALYSVLHDRAETNALKYGDSSFNCDSRGRWYLNICVPVEVALARATNKPVGIDLGLKDLAALSTGQIIENPRQLSRLADKLARAQRGNKKTIVATVHAKIRNCRADFLHKLSRQIVSRHDLIVVGNVSSSWLTKTRLAKSVLDAGWATLRHQLEYKAVTHGSRYAEVSEYLTTQTCSSCGCLPPTRPVGFAGLRMRQFDCSECGLSLNRDVNSALNILARFSQKAPVEGAAQVAELTIPVEGYRPSQPTGGG